MKGFYDKIVPDYLNSYGKKYGVQVQMEGLPVKISDDLNFPVEASEAAGLPSHVPGGADGFFAARFRRKR